MKSRTRVFLTSVALVAVVAALSSGLGAPPDRPLSPIPLSELRERGVAGRLGPRMGTIVTVTGVVVANTSRAKADVSEPYFLDVDTVDGQKLATPQRFASSAMQLIRAARSLKIGDRFNCVGYESGDFRGSPDGEFKYVEPYATQSFFFHEQFVVLKAN